MKCYQRATVPLLMALGVIAGAMLPLSIADYQRQPFN